MQLLNVNITGQDTAVAWLTRREHDILRELCHDGASNKEIAARLGISTDTVKGYISRLTQSLGVSNRAALVGWGLRHPGIISTGAAAITHPHDCACVSVYCTAMRHGSIPTS